MAGGPWAHGLTPLPPQCTTGWRCGSRCASWASRARSFAAERGGSHRRELGAELLGEATIFVRGRQLPGAGVLAPPGAAAAQGGGAARRLGRDAGRVGHLALARRPCHEGRRCRRRRRRAPWRLRGGDARSRSCARGPAVHPGPRPRPRQCPHPEVGAC